MNDMESARTRVPDDASLAEPTLRDRLSVDDHSLRRDAALALVDRAEEGFARETTAALADRVRADDHSDVRQFAAEALGAAGVFDDALVAALEDPDEWVRAEAVVALSRAGGDADALAAAVDDESGWVRRNAVIALCKRGDATQEMLVDRLENDPHSAVREYAAGFLGTVATDTEEAVRVLAAVLARDPDAFARAKAATALGELGTDRAERALETQGLPDRSDDVTRAAERALATARGEDPSEIDAGGGCEDGPDLAPDAAVGSRTPRPPGTGRERSGVGGGPNTGSNARPGPDLDDPR